MNGFKFTIISIISFLVVVLLQINIFNKLTVFGVTANLFIVYCVYNCILCDNDKLSIGIILISGLIYDICFGNLLGINALIGFLITILTPVFCNRVAIDTRIGMMLYVFICTFISQIFYGAIYLILNGGIFVLDRFIIIVLITSIYNLIITLFVHSIFNKYLKEKDEMYKIIRRY